MPDALATALAQFGLAGFVAWMWLTERRDGESVTEWLIRTGRRKGVLA